MKSSELDCIYNFLSISESIATSGQPQREQFILIENAGYRTIVNLALPNSTNALSDEREIVENLGMNYYHIPVIWENPKVEDLMEFFAIMDDRSTEKVFVHCAMNMRVSAFVYLYRARRQKIDPAIAILDLQKIWQPNEIWQSFIDLHL